MAVKKFLSYTVAVFLGLLAIAPPISYHVSLGFNSFPWIYIVIASGLFGFFLWYQDIHLSLKIFITTLFFSQFLSQEPADSFTAYVLVVMAVYFFLLCKKCDFDIIINMVQAVFWYQIAISFVQFTGHDKLMCFGSSLIFNDQGELVKQSFDHVHHVYFGTVFQQMRLASLFTVMAPFLIIKSRWYIIPLLIMSVAMNTLGFSFALAFGIMVWSILEIKETRTQIYVILFALLFCVGVSLTNNHIHVEIMEGRWPIWWVILKSWCCDTMKNFHGFNSTLNPSPQAGPFSWHFFLFGHGLDTFITLFQFYKYDKNPFPNPHNDYLKILWETGLVNFIFFSVWYPAQLIWGLFKQKEFQVLGCLLMIAVNRFFAFPDCMTQTMYLMIAYLAYCEIKKDKKQWTPIKQSF